jgi:hypothetical protein
MKVVEVQNFIEFVSNSSAEVFQFFEYFDNFLVIVKMEVQIFARA